MFSSMLSLLGSIRGGSSFITNSLRFRSSASAYLSRTPAAAGSRTTWTWSGWVKRGTLGSAQFLMSTLNTQEGRFGFAADDSFTITAFGSPGEGYYAASNAKFRDTSAWYHIVVVYDSTNATPALRQRVYVNNSELTWASPSLITTSGLQGAINSATAHSIARYVNGTAYFDGYLTDVNFIDGQALTPASFGAIDSSTGVWAPRPYSGTYGANGFYLKFSNTSSVAALGNDSSGNAIPNNWTVNNVSLTAGATYDSMIDVPVNYSDGGNGRGNYCTLNPVFVYGNKTISDANLQISTGTTGGSVSSISVNTGKWYWETTISSITAGGYRVVGISKTSSAQVSLLTSSIYIQSDGTYSINNGSNTAYGASLTNGDVVGVALDVDARTIVFYKNGTAMGAAISISLVYSSGEDVVASAVSSGGVSASLVFNFGQRPFQFPVPAGFRALNTNNLPTPSIVNGANFMAATTYTGNAAARSLSNAVNSVSFQPDLVWIKSRTPGATSHALFDSVRGTTTYLSSNTTTTETTLAQSLTAFGADGFSLGTDATLVNANANSYVAWQWKAGGAAVSNTQGTITSQVSANTTAGFSVVTYTGTGVNATVGHGLGVAPKMVIVKNRDVSTENWNAWHTGLLNTATRIILNLTNAQDSASPTIWNNNINPTSATFSIGTSVGTNGSTNKMVAYCFAEIAGFSRFGSYTGNGSTDGPFVFCGFRPRWVMVKAFSGANAGTMWWQIYDTSRDTYNVVSSYIEPNSAKVETAASSPYLDVVSNGFKLRSANGYQNDTGYNYIFAAFAEVPSKYALAR